MKGSAKFHEFAQFAGLDKSTIKKGDKERAARQAKRYADATKEEKHRCV